MDKFVIRTKTTSIPNVGSSATPNQSQGIGGSVGNPETDSVVAEDVSVDVVRGDVVVDGVRREKRARTENTCEDELEFNRDPGLRKPIDDYDPSDRDEMRRMYVVKGPCQPLTHDFPRTEFGPKSRSFVKDWFKKWDWLEYSVSKDAAFCFWCYLFKPNMKNRGYRSDVFVETGFRNWKKASEKFRDHVGSAGSYHNEARTMFFKFQDQRQCIEKCISSGKQALAIAYRIRLTAILDVVRLLLCQALAFRGHDESASSLSKGNFLEIIDWYSARNVDVAKVMKENAPLNHQLTSPKIQKDLISACASETIKAILADVGDKVFSLLIDEARDISIKEQMAIVVRYVNNRGEVMERFLGVVHVVDTTSVSLKRGIEEFFAKYGLSISKLRGEGYDGASNMRGELGGLKTLLLEENPYARYIHCFVHQLQLVIVAVSEANNFVSDFFQYLSMITNMAGASCKRKDQLRQSEHEKMVNKLEKGELTTGKGLNQETSLARPGATRWGSHFTTIARLLSLWDSTIEVLENVLEDGTTVSTRGTADSLIVKMETYQFVFVAHLMKTILGMTNALSQLLQQKDQNIIQAMSMVQSIKRRFQVMRNEGWDDLIRDVNQFCVDHDILILNMDDEVPSRHRSRRAGHIITNNHQFRVEIFYEVIDQIGQELESRFSESSTELLTCMACLDPKDSFSDFDSAKLHRLTQLYLVDFSLSDQVEITEELKAWVYEMRNNPKFSDLEDIGDVSKKMVEVGIHKAFQLVYRLLELVLVLPVATTTVERAFSAMSLIKTYLRNKMGDDFLTDSLVCYIEKDIFKRIDNEVILQHFQGMKTRKMDLPPLSSS